MAWRNGGASGSGMTLGIGQMQEYRTAKVAPARSFIMRKYDQHVIEPVIPPEPFMACRVGQGDQSIVIAILRRVAPSIPTPQGLHGKTRLRPGDPVWPEHDPAQRPAAGGRGAVAFPLY